MRTLRSKNERNWFYIKADGKCQICGDELKNNWHIDHIIPFSICKKTELNNLQITCKTCNLKKGNKMLRKHQRELKEQIESIVQNYKATGFLNKKKIIVSAFPGGGKSLLPIIAGKILKDAGIIEKMAIIVPRKSLKSQGAQEFKKGYIQSIFPNNLEIRESGNDINPSHGSFGFIVTYNALVSAKSNNSHRTNAFEYDFQKNDYCLFLDEFHHVVEDSKDIEGYNFYKAIKPLVENAKFLICVSGTPFRHLSTEKIAFLDFQESINEIGEKIKQPILDIEYTYEDAIREKAIIPLHHNLGNLVHLSYIKKSYKNEESVIKTSIENGTDLAVAIDSGYGKNLLELGLKHWQDYRNRINLRSKLIIVGHDQKHCREIVKSLSKVGVESCLAISDEKENAHIDIENFRKKSTSKVLVTCQMAYEGLDCREATHIIILTRITSLPWLIQVFTRPMRFDADGLPYEKQYAMAFVPDYEPFRIALEILRAKQEPIIVDPFEEDFEEIKEKLGEIPADLDVATPSIENKESSMDGVTQGDAIEEIELSNELLIKINAFQTKWNIHSSEKDTYKMLRDNGMLSALDEIKVSTEIEVKVNNPMTIKEREDYWKKKIQKLTNKLDFEFIKRKILNKSGNTWSYGDWNKLLHNMFRFKKRSEMDESELKHCYDVLISKAKKELNELTNV